MEGLDFAAVYKRLIDANFAPEPERNGAALRTILDCLARGSPPGICGNRSEIPMENNR